MASGKQLLDAIIEIFTRLDKSRKAPVRDPGIQTPDWAAMKKAQEAVPKSIQAKQDVNQLNLERATDKALAGQTEVRGHGPAALTSASGTKFDPLKEAVRDKGFITELEEEFNKLGRAGIDPRSLSEEAATKIVESRRAAGKPKRKFTTVQERERVQQGRKAAIRRGEQKFIPRGNPEDFGERPLTFGESEFGTPSEVTSLIDEATGPTRSVNKGIVKNKFGSIEQEGAKETMENLFTAEDATRAGNIQDELEHDVFLRTLSPDLQRQITEETLVPRSIRLKRIDEIGKLLKGGKGTPGKIPELESALAGKDISGEGTTFKTTPRARTKSELEQGSRSSKQLHQFRILSAKTLDAAREANRIKPNMEKVQGIISKMPQQVQDQLSNAVESGLELDEALYELTENLLKRMN
jgi:hypothetical protein